MSSSKCYYILIYQKHRGVENKSIPFKDYCVPDIECFDTRDETTYRYTFYLQLLLPIFFLSNVEWRFNKSQLQFFALFNIRLVSW